MKTCHLCEKIVKVLRCTTCITCKRAFCYQCISKHFPSEASKYLPQSQADALNRSKVIECFYCLKKCTCFKCQTRQSIVFVPVNKMIAEEQNKSLILNKDDQLTPQTGIFKGKKIAELPNFLQRIYMKKKVLYSKHELSVPSNINISAPQVMNVEQMEQNQQNKLDPKDLEDGVQNRESVQYNNMGDESLIDKNQMDVQQENMENEDEQGEENQNEFDSEEQSNENNEYQEKNSIPNQSQKETQRKNNNPILENQQKNIQGENSVKENDQSRKKNKQIVREALENVQNQSSIQIVQE